MWYAYWLIALLFVTIVPVFLVPAATGAKFRDKLGVFVGQILSNNNYRLVGLYVAAILFTFSAIIAGLGEPMLDAKIEVAEDKAAEVTQTLNQMDDFKANLVTFFGNGTVSLEAKPPGPPSTPTSSASPYNRLTAFLRYGDEPSSYASWWHWPIALLAWLAALIYTPIALREEIAHAFAEAYESFKSETTSGETEVPAGTTTEAKSKGGLLGGFFKDFAMAFGAAFVEDKIGLS